MCPDICDSLLSLFTSYFLIYGKSQWINVSIPTNTYEILKKVYKAVWLEQEKANESEGSTNM